MTHIDQFYSSTTSYLIALISMTSLNDLAVLIGVLLGVVRLAYDSIRLFRYVRNPEHRA